MTIQIKRGNAADRPNPLLNGEFGWDADGRRLWIGNGVVNENLFVAGAAALADFSVYVCTTALGGGAGDADGLAKNSGTATATGANKLVDAAAAFDSSYANKTVYNKTDDTWARITAVDSATQLSLSANIMAAGESYETTNAFATVLLGFAAVPGPYSANVTLRISPGTFSEAVTFIGKIAAGAKTLTVQGSTTGTTTLSGAVEISQKITIKNITFSGTTINANYGAELAWTTCPLVNTRLNTRNGSDLSWSTCNGSGTTKLYTYIGSKNLVTTSTVTKGYTIYVATTALGGDDAVADGLAITSGPATGTTANKLVDSGANFTSALVGKTVWNSTDDTWAKVTAMDSATQLSISANIMASGEAYVIADAYSTIQGAVDAIPGAVNCNISIRISNGTFTENITVQGKTTTGNYTLKFIGTLTVLDSLAAGAGSVKGNAATRATAVRNSGTWTLNQRQHKLLRFTSGVCSGITRVIDSNIAGNTATLVSTWHNDALGGTPASGDTFVVEDWGTIIDASTTGNGITIASGQKAVEVTNLRIINGGALLPSYSGIHIFSFGEAKCYRCNLDNPSSGIFGMYVDASASGELSECFIGPQASGTTGIWVAQWAIAIARRTKIYKVGRTGQGVRADGGKVQVFWGSIIDNTGATGYGLLVNSQGLGLFYSGVGNDEGTNFVMNANVGVQAQAGGQVALTYSPYVSYSGNTTNENAVLASYGYID